MKLIVVDLEFNQPSGKIIQIGAVFADLKAKRILSSFNSICNPGELPNEFISNLTGISPLEVENAPDIKIACQEFWNWVEKTECKKLSGWGGNELDPRWSGDVPMLIDQSKACGIVVPERVKNINLKHVVSPFLSVFKVNGSGVKKVLSAFGGEFVGRQHNAYHDAYNTALIFFKIYGMLETLEKLNKVFNTDFVTTIKCQQLKDSLEEYKDKG